jgi:hypothetical protein
MAHVTRRPHAAGRGTHAVAVLHEFVAALLALLARHLPGLGTFLLVLLFGLGLTSHASKRQSSQEPQRRSA